ncbi:MAG: M23 family metallopeptidase [Saprospiraceae bacterium]
MSEQSQEQNWRERLQHTYRLVVMNNDTFEETGSYKLTLLNVYVMISTVIVLLALFVFLMIAFTPIRRYIPGYGDIEQHAALMEIHQKIEEMEKQANANEQYTDNFRRILVGDVETIEDAQEGAMEPESVDSLEVDKVIADEELRREVELDEIGTAAQLSRASGFSTDKPLAQMYFTPPMTGEISASYMPDKGHYGVDVLAPANTPVKSVMDGFVFISDWTMETGNTIGIQHSNNVITFYKHNSSLLKEIGDYVKAGEAVAIIGNTGTLSDGPHLHFELWHKGNHVDPTDFVNF